MFYEVEIVVKQTKGIKKMDNLLQLQHSASMYAIRTFEEKKLP